MVLEGHVEDAMANHAQPLAQELTPKAKEEGISRMQTHLSRRSGRERTREDARAAFENLLGFYATVCEWNARAVLEDRAAAPGAPHLDAPSPTAPRKRSTGRKANHRE